MMSRANSIMIGGSLTLFALGYHRYTRIRQLNKPLNIGTWKSLEVNNTINRAVTQQDTIATKVCELDDNTYYNIGIARKNIVLTFSHSALALKRVNAHTNSAELIILGRQSPVDEMNNATPDEKIPQSQWLYKNSVGRLDTKIENEKQFNFFPSIPYSVQMLSHEITLTGAEIKKIVQQTNSNVCERESFNLVKSNCYSATTSMVADIIQTIDARPPYPNKANDIACVYEGLLRPLLTDNFSQGVSNHASARSSIVATHDILTKHRLIG